MNLLLLEDGNSPLLLDKKDPRAEHILKVLRMKEGDRLDIGLVNGPRGKALLTRIDTDNIELQLEWGEETPPLYPVTLLTGLPRPQTARKILQEVTALGVSRFIFFASEKGEASYASSSLWSSSEWRRHLLSGVEQAFSTKLPELEVVESLEKAIHSTGATHQRYALDVYEGTIPFGNAPLNQQSPLSLAIGSERGWSPAERDLLRHHDFTLCHLGDRVLRTETASVAGVSIALAKAGYI